jgi:FeS assembly protein IscX
MRWRDAEEIAELLEEHYAEEDIPEHDMQSLEEMVRAMDEDDFEGYLEDPTSEELEDIKAAWQKIREA